MHASALTARTPTLDGNAHWHLTEREENGAMDGILTDIPAKAAARTWLSDFEAALASGGAARTGPRRRPHAAAAREARGHRGDRGDLHIRDLGRSLQRRRAPGPGGGR